jgi:hypothetical protein
MPVTMLEEPARSSTESSAASSGLDLEDIALTLHLPGPDRKRAASTSDPTGSRSPRASDAPPSSKYAARARGD